MTFINMCGLYETIGGRKLNDKTIEIELEDMDNRSRTMTLTIQSEAAIMWSLGTKIEIVSYSDGTGEIYLRPKK
jgi:hypothetical protein